MSPRRSSTFALARANTSVPAELPGTSEGLGFGFDLGASERAATTRGDSFVGADCFEVTAEDSELTFAGIFVVLEESPPFAFGFRPIARRLGNNRCTTSGVIPGLNCFLEDMLSSLCGDKTDVQRACVNLDAML